MAFVRKRSSYQPRHLRRPGGAVSVWVSGPSTESPEVVSQEQELVMEAASDQQSGRSAALMGILIVVSRLTGFLRTWGQAYALGVTVLASCYTVANNLPNQLYELVMGGMLITAFLPVYLSVRRKLGTEGASRYASNLVSIVLLFMGILTLLAFIFAGQAVWTQSFDAKQDFDFELTTWFFRFFVIEIMLYALSSILSGILNAERDYLWSTAAPIFNNFVCLASFLLYAYFAPTSPQLALVILALGNPLGVLIQVVLQIPSLARLGIKLRPRFDFRDPALKETMSIGIPALIVTFISFVTFSVQNSSALSASGEGASIAYYARLWYTLPYAILAVPITTVMFTELSNSIAAGDMPSFIRRLSKGISQLIFLLTPFMMFLVLFAPYLACLLAGGKFEADDVASLSSYIRWLSIALPSYGVCSYLQKACSAVRKLDGFAWANIIAGALQIACCIIFTPIFGLNVVAFSTAVFFVSLDVITLLALRRDLGSLGFMSMIATTVRSFIIGALGCVCAAAIMIFVGQGLNPSKVSMMQAFMTCLIAGLPALVAAFGGALVLRMPEMKFLTGIVQRRRG